MNAIFSAQVFTARNVVNTQESVLECSQNCMIFSYCSSSFVLENDSCYYGQSCLGALLSGMHTPHPAIRHDTNGSWKACRATDSP